MVNNENVNIENLVFEVAKGEHKTQNKQIKSVWGVC